MAKIQYSLIRQVKDPSVSYDSAGVDFYMPVDLHEDEIKIFEDIIIDTDLFWNVYQITINPGGRVLIPSGIRLMGMDRSSALIAFNKSGVASKAGLVVGAQVVDYDYRGEVHINLINTSCKPKTIKAGEKLTQFIHVPILKSIWERVPESLINASSTDRGSKGFGSTNVETAQL